MRQENTYRNAVMNLQRYLRQLNFNEDINRIPIDGIYGDETRDALIEFQTLMGLTASGVADMETWDILFAEYQKSIEKNSSGIGIVPFFDRPPDYELNIGDENTLVSVLEIMLEEISSEYSGLILGFEKNGIFDKTKADIIYEYQRVNLLDATGRVDKITWNRLAEDFNTIIRKNE